MVNLSNMAWCMVVKCRNQLDCVWVFDESGETICVEKVTAGTADSLLRESACRCYDESRTDNVTGRCIELIEQYQPSLLGKLLMVRGK